MRIVALSAALSVWLGAAAALATDASAPHPNGDACTLGGECLSSHCADGVCCNTACDGQCEACVAGKKQTGKDSGSCGPVRGGTDPDDECAAEAQSSCGLTGVCAGAAAVCARFPLGTPCDSGSVTQCQNGSFLGRACDGQGTCSVNPFTSPTSCGDYVCRPDDSTASCSATPCAGHCASPCATSADCSDAQKRCVSGACVPKLGLGAVCASDAECTAGHCADGVCCNTTCTGACESCNQPSKTGTCSPLPAGAAPPSHGGCLGTGPCAGTCTGQPECTYPRSDTECASASCNADSAVDARTCDGSGECSAAQVHDCGEYTCSAAKAACNTTCATSADCKGGGTCITAAHTCTTAGATCDGDYAVKATDGTVTSCAGYRCVSGKCQQTCASELDCAPEHACTASACVARTDAGVPASSGGAGGAPHLDASASGGGTPSPDSGPGAASPSAGHDSGGCGCTLGGAPSPAGAGTLLLAASVALGRRKRRARAATLATR